MEKGLKRYLASRLSYCAVSRLMISLAQPGNTQKEVFGSFNLPGVERRRGK